MELIDISHWQNYIDFEKVKNFGIEGCIIKAGGSDSGFYKDSYFEDYYKKAKEVNLHVGAYYFAGKNFLSAEDGKADAVRFLEIIKGKQFDLPIYLDIEAQPSERRKEVTEAAIAFCVYLESKGYFVGIYASDISGFKDRLYYNDIANKYTIWVAHYGCKPIYCYNYDIWQYTSTAKVDGIFGNVDRDICYKDFPEIIKSKKLNGYSEEPILKTNEEIAEEVIKGLWRKW